jgi:hypothetical protein
MCLSQIDRVKWAMVEEWTNSLLKRNRHLFLNHTRTCKKTEKMNGEITSCGNVIIKTREMQSNKCD